MKVTMFSVQICVRALTKEGRQNLFPVQNLDFRDEILCLLVVVGTVLVEMFAVRTYTESGQNNGSNKKL
jgi:hypothetical protein